MINSINVNTPVNIVLLIFLLVTIHIIKNKSKKRDIIEQNKKRDEDDRNKEMGALKIADDAIIVDSYNIEIKGFYYDARPLPNELKYDLIIPQEYQDVVENKYRYYLWYKDDSETSSKIGIVTRKKNSTEITLSDVFCVVKDDDFENIIDTDGENWISIVNTEDDGDNILKFSWM